MNITMIVPFYRQPLMLAEQLARWAEYDSFTRAFFKFVVVDDGSPESAADVVDASRMAGSVEVYRILPDIPWNRGGARNLGATMCQTEWMLHVDTDHVLPAESAAALLRASVWFKPERWYRFSRWRKGRADDTRRKDALPDDCEFGEVKPHIDSYLCTPELYWRVGGYDEDYSGMLGGGSPFLAQMSAAAELELCPSDAPLHVYTRGVIADSSISTLSRDTSRYSALRKEKERTNTVKAQNPIRFEWSKVR